MRLTLVSPRLAIQRGDFLGSGVPYWPIELAVLASVLREHGAAVSVVDLFGSNPAQLESCDDCYLQGVPLDRLLQDTAIADAEGFIVYAISYMAHRELIQIIGTLRRGRPTIKIAVLENSQAVTAYSLPRLSGEFFAAGADLLICGEPHFNWEEIAPLFGKESAPPPQNVIVPTRTTPVVRRIEKSMRYPVPAWDLFNLEGYWSLPYSHGPKSGTFFPILTSRGCPYPCDFCVVPETNDRRWRARAVEDVVDEILTLRDRYGVRHFQVEDLNPTISHHRWEDLCRLLIARNAGVFLYLVSGTKAETVHVDQVPLLARAGCRYISISPESGSSDVMRIIGKPFNQEHGIQLIRACKLNRIRTQACFLVGHPAETAADFQASKSYLRQLVRAGLDEVAVFIVAPFAGSALYANDAIRQESARPMPSFSPKGRKDYKDLANRRSQLIHIFFWEKLWKGSALWLQGLRALFGRPETKMENLPRRIMFIFWLIGKQRFFGFYRIKG